MSDGRKAKLVL